MQEMGKEEKYKKKKSLSKVGTLWVRQSGPCPCYPSQPCQYSYLVIFGKPYIIRIRTFWKS